MWVWIFPTCLYVLNFISIFSIIFFRRKDTSVTFAWLLVLIFLPLIGFILYFFFGSTYKLSMMTKKFRLSEVEKRYNDTLEERLCMIKPAGFVFRDEKTGGYKDMVVLNMRNGGALFTEDNEVELLVDGQAKFPRLFAEIEQAKKSIHVMYFIIKSKDPIGKEFIALLAKKAAEGVEVKVLYDGIGCPQTRFGDFDVIVRNGGVVQRFLPSMIRTLLTANYRLHRKMVVIDGQVCYTGGINVGDDYLGNYPHITPWRDTSVRLTGSAVSAFQLLFFRDWVFCAKQNRKLKRRTIQHLSELAGIEKEYFPEPKEPGVMGVQVIECGPDSQYAVHKDSYVKICTEAKEYLYIQSPYFVPDQTLLDAIRMAAQGGVDVRMMLPGLPDKWYVYQVAMSYVQELLEAGVRIYTHAGFLHAKTMVIDDYVASVGSTNLDIRSFKLDYEVNTLVYSETFAKTCKATFLEDIKDSQEIELEAFRKRGAWRYILESLCRFIAPLS